MAQDYVVVVKSKDSAKFAFDALRNGEESKLAQSFKILKKPWGLVAIQNECYLSPSLELLKLAANRLAKAASNGPIKVAELSAAERVGLEALLASSPFGNQSIRKAFNSPEFKVGSVLNLKVSVTGSKGTVKAQLHLGPSDFEKEIVSKNIVTPYSRPTTELKSAPKPIEEMWDAAPKILVETHEDSDVVGMSRIDEAIIEFQA
ncbi:MAG TPA: hypothetical protein VJ835_10575 [Fimbriimonadaceae bacterium]|nr:hypothetical protein [Fimbriimonadaceae bacterium]